MAKKKSKTIPAKTRKNSPVNLENHNRSPLAQKLHIALGGLGPWAKRTSEGPTKVKVTPAASKRRKSTDALIAKKTPKQTKATEAARAKKFASLKKKNKKGS